MIVLMAIVASRMQVPKVGLTRIVLLIVCTRIGNILMTSESAYFRPLSLFPRSNCQISNAYWILSLGCFIGILNSFCPKHKSSLIFHLNLICILSCLTTLSLTSCPVKFLGNHSMYFFSLLLRHKSPFCSYLQFN